MTQNENQLTNTQTGEILETELIVQDTENFTVYLQNDGKYRKEMKYVKEHTKIPKTDEEMKELFRVFNGQDDKLVTPMARLEGKEIEVLNYYTNPYTSFDEETGRNTNGVTTTIETKDGYVATSSKSVYYTLRGICEVFGHPADEDYKPIKVKIVGKQLQNGRQIDIDIV